MLCSRTGGDISILHPVETAPLFLPPPQGERLTIIHDTVQSYMLGTGTSDIVASGGFTPPARHDIPGGSHPPLAKTYNFISPRAVGERQRLPTAFFAALGLVLLSFILENIFRLQGYLKGVGHPCHVIAPAHVPDRVQR